MGVAPRHCDCASLICRPRQGFPHTPTDLLGNYLLPIGIKVPSTDSWGRDEIADTAGRQEIRRDSCDCGV